MSMEGSPGYKVTGRNGNWIFLPAAGIYKDNGQGDLGVKGYYMTGSVSEEEGNGFTADEYYSSSSQTGTVRARKFHDALYMRGLYFGKDFKQMQGLCRSYGYPVRPVKK